MRLESKTVEWQASTRDHERSKTGRIELLGFAYQAAV